MPRTITKITNNRINSTIDNPTINQMRNQRDKKSNNFRKNILMIIKIICILITNNTLNNNSRIINTKIILNNNISNNRLIQINLRYKNMDRIKNSVNLIIMIIKICQIHHKISSCKGNNSKRNIKIIKI